MWAITASTAPNTFAILLARNYKNACELVKSSMKNTFGLFFSGHSVKQDVLKSAQLKAKTDVSLICKSYSKISAKF